jgi:hypothetical protein
MSATELLEPILKGGIRSINFFNGRLLSAEDLSDEQNANRQGRALVGQAAGEGVVYGLEVARSGAGTNLSPVVTVSAGLALNRRGQALRLPSPTDVALARQAGGDASLPATLIFKDCQQAQGGVNTPAEGLYLLTVAASEGREGRAPTSGLGNASAPCSARYVVEGVQFRLIELLKSNALGDLNSLRNRAAYQCFGIETLKQFESAPFGQPPRRYGLLDTLRPNVLTDGDVPLAAIYWTRNGGLEFIDLWSVRRRPVRPSVSERWGALIDDRRHAEAEAMLLQFQEQIAALQAAALQTPINLGNYKADERFAYLPPVGLLPVGAGAFNWRTFLGPHAPPEETNLDEGLLRSIIERSVFIDPVKINPFAGADVSGQTPPIPLTVYRVASNNDFVMFARSTRGRIRVFLGPAHTNVPGNQIYAEASRTDTRHYAAGGAGGVYQIVGLDAGAYRVTVSTSAFGATASTVVTEGRTTDVPFTSGAPGNINVTPRDKQTDEPITDLSKILSVTATPSQGGSPIPGSSAGGGVWRIDNLVAGTYTVTANVTGYLPHTPVPVVLAAGQAAQLDIELDPVPANNAVINLQVFDKATNHRIDAAVQSARATNLQPPNDVRLGEETGDAWSIRQLPAGNYRVEVTATDYQSETIFSVPLTAGQQVNLAVRMQATPGAIALTVGNVETGAPINEAVTNVKATNDNQVDFPGTFDPADGKWKIRNLPPGTYSFTVVATGFQTKVEHNIAVQANQTLSREIRLTPAQVPTGSLTFSILDVDSRHAIDDKVTGITATLGSTTRPATQDTTTRKWSITGLAPGAYSIEVAATNYKGKTVPDTQVVSGQMRNIEISLEPSPGSITVSATHSGASINDKVTKVTATSGRGSFPGAADGSQWKVSNLKPDTYSVAIEARDYQPKTEQGVTLTPGQARTLNVAMEPQLGSIRLTINDTRGAPIDGSVTNVTANGPSGSVTGARDPADGKWKISNLRPGTYSVAASALNYTGTPSNVEVTSNAQTTATLRLEPNKGTLTLKLDVFAAPESDEFLAVHLVSTSPPLPPGVELTAVITPGNLSTIFADDAIERQISNVPVSELLTVTINTHPLTIFRLELPPGGQASRTVPVAPTSFGFRAGHPDHQHTLHSYLIEPEQIRTPLNKTPQTPDATERPWLTLWRNWLILTRPELGLDSTREPAIVVNTTRSGSVVSSSGHAVFFRADNTNIGLTYENTVTTVRPGTG